MPDTLLRRALLGNAAFSATSGVALIVFAVPLSGFLDFPAVVLLGLGAGLVPFGILVAGVARARKPMAVRLVIAADLVWVAGAAGVLLVIGGSMTITAVATLGLVTIAVADFAALQWWGLRRARAAG